MQAIDVRIIGPFHGLFPAGKSVFLSPYSGKKRVYTHSIPTMKGNQVYYFGQTSKSFSERLSQHLGAYLSGQYHVYDGAIIRKGVKTLIFEGWMNSKPREKARLEYLHNVSTIAPKTFELLDAMLRIPVKVATAR